MWQFKGDELPEFLKLFPDEKSCLDHLMRTRWNELIVSPFDEASRVYVCSGDRFRCQNTGKYFTATTGTVFQGTRVPLQVWYYAIFIMSRSTRAITSTEMGKKLGISQKSAYQMTRRIKRHFGGNLASVQRDNIEKLDVILDDDKLRLTDWLKLIKK